MRNKPQRDQTWTCPVPLCTTGAKRGFYRIPENPVRRAAWITACNLPIDIRKTASICWKHFKKSDFQMEMDEKDVNELGMGMLNRNVTPSECLPVIFDSNFDIQHSLQEIRTQVLNKVVII